MKWGNVENSFAEILEDFYTEVQLQTLASMCRVCVGYSIAGTVFITFVCYSCVSLIFRQYIIL